MTQRIQKGSLAIDEILYNFIENEALPHAGISSDDYWANFEKIVNEFTPRNKELLAKRGELQQKINEWHKANPSQNGSYDQVAYKAFLQEIGYLVEEGEDFSITTENVDAEIATIAGPQLVVPVRNARFALNAANARWGSFYDALYGTDVIAAEENPVAGYDPRRGAKVIAYAKAFLDKHFALANGSYNDVTGFAVVDGALEVAQGDSKTTLADAKQFVGFVGEAGAPTGVLLKNNGLHAEIQIDANHTVGKDDPANIKDVLLESAVTTIQDCEDSVAAVDAEEKTEVYRNWLGLMLGTLESTFSKGGKQVTRTMNKDRVYTAANGEELVLSGRSCMLVRNVGHLMTNPAVLVGDAGEEIFEGIMDALVTPMLTVKDLKGTNELSNSRTGSMYIVKPKQHGPEEVQFSVELFAAVEKALNLPENSLKMGIMDEERRTTVNLKECIRVAKERTIFINTGFMDRTGDEIHTSMQAGAMVRKGEMKAQPWLDAYENWNVDVGAACGLTGKAQIGKGMWPKPDSFKEMMTSKLAHPQAGATCAWVPSPTGATLHATHYHEVDVFDVLENTVAKREHASVDTIITIPLAKETNWTDAQKTEELDNNCQGILGYVVRWVDQGVGCSKVLDIHNVGLMEDRATLRISSQHVANWLTHGVVTREQVLESLKRMAVVVDEQNAGDSEYVAMAPSFDGLAFKAACDLVFEGTVQPSGYTEPLLHAARLELKAQA